MYPDSTSLLARQLELLHRRSAAGHLAAAAVAAIVGWLMVDSAPPAAIAGWVLWAWVVIAMQFGLSRRPPGRDRDSLSRWRGRLIAASALQGAAWGAAAALALPRFDETHALLVGLILAGTAAAGATALAPLWMASVAFSVACLLPPSIALAAEGAPHHLHLGSASLLFLISLLVTSRRLHRFVHDALFENLRNERLAARLEKLSATAPGVITLFRLAPDGTRSFPYAAPGITAIYGLTADALAKDAAPTVERVHPDDLDRVEEAVEHSARTLEPWHCEFRVRHPQRGEIWIEGRSVPERQPDGAVQWYGFLHDVTERKHAEGRLAEARAFTERLIDAIPDPIFVKDRQHRWHLFNEAFRAMIGHPRETLLGKTDHDFFPPEQANVFWDKDEVVFATDRENLNEECITGADGEVRWIQTKKAVVPNGGDRWLIGVIRDITQRKHAEEALQASEAKLRGMYELSPLGMALTDIDGRYVEFNEAFRAICGYPEEELKRLDYWTLTPREYAPQEDEQLRALAETGRYGPYEKEYLRKDGTRVPIRLNGMLMTAPDGNDYIWSIVEDITEQRAAENAREAALDEARRLAAARGSFLSQMSHELRTPLNGILGFAQLLQLEQRLGGEARHWVNLIRQSGEHLEALIEQVLDFAKIEADRIELSHEAIALAPFLDTVAGIIRVKAEAKGVEFLLLTEPALPATFGGDPLRLRQILLNLLGNAIKFTDEGRVTLRVARPGPARLRFEIEDDGIGIAAEKLPTIFEPFEQVSDTRRATQGTGLGLAISRRLARLMGGEIAVESRPGEGSLFAFELPVPSTDGAIEVAAVIAAEPPSPTAERPTDDATADHEPLPPPPEELAALLDLARRGNPRAVARRAATFADDHARYRPFADRLAAMAKGYQTKAMEQWLERCGKEETAP